MIWTTPLFPPKPPPLPSPFTLFYFSHSILSGSFWFLGSGISLDWAFSYTAPSNWDTHIQPFPNPLLQAHPLSPDDSPLLL